MRKYIITILSTIISIALFQGLFLWLASAALSTNDCDKAISSWDEVTWEIKYGNIYPYKNFLIARSHLLAYCCKEKFRKDENYKKYCTADLPINFPESDFFYDHLIDVWFRSLDVVGIYDGQIVDKDAQERNIFITDPTKATTPIIIQNEYTKNRSQKRFLSNTTMSWYNEEAWLWGVTLADKYVNLCYLIKRIYSDEKLVGYIERNINSYKYYKDCRMVANYRINQEYSLAKLLMAQASIRTLTDSIKSYAIDEFVQNRLMKLFDKLSDISELFSTISSQASLTEKCSN